MFLRSHPHSGWDLAESGWDLAECGFMRSYRKWMRSYREWIRSSREWMRSSREWMKSSQVWMRSIQVWMRSSRMWKLRSCLVVRASDCNSRNSRNSPGFYPSILRQSRIWGAADEALLNKVHKKIQKNPCYTCYMYEYIPQKSTPTFQ